MPPEGSSAFELSTQGNVRKLVQCWQQKEWHQKITRRSSERRGAGEARRPSCRVVLARFVTQNKIWSHFTTFKPTRYYEYLTCDLCGTCIHTYQSIAPARDSLEVEVFLPPPCITRTKHNNKNNRIERAFTTPPTQPVYFFYVGAAALPHHTATSSGTQHVSLRYLFMALCVTCLVVCTEFLLLPADS